MNKYWQCGRYQIDLTETKIMGVLNCTPDSFSDGGKYAATNKAIKHAEEMIEDGVDIIDIGGESTRPGALPVTPQEEIKRISEIIKAVHSMDIPISVDTKNAETMKAALDLGADIINDVNGLEGKGAVEAVSHGKCGLVIMHMRGTPENMQSQTDYEDLILEINQYFAARIEIMKKHHISSDRICIDPGFGFAKTPAQNMELIAQVDEFLTDYPVLIGVSNKKTIGCYLGVDEVEKRNLASITLSALGAYLGAKVVRVHDVKSMKEALKITEALKNPK